MKFRYFPLLLSLAAASLAAVNFALVPIAEIKPKSISESSGIAKSRQFENVYWTHNDSGDSNRIFAITLDGDPIQTEWAEEKGIKYEGIEVGEATNIDWEDISTDDQGNLLIAACGNNDNARRDLAIYILPEPDPRYAFKARASKRVDFHFPDQKKFPDPDNKNFDCESLFFAHGKPYFVSKNRSEAPAKLYRLDQMDTSKSNPATLISDFPLGGQATGADATPDGKKLAIITYTGLWVFIAPEGSDDYFAGESHYRPFFAKQCEAVCWKDDETLIVTNEQRDIFELSLSDIPAFTPPGLESK
ncbi:hypothetical protein [Pelagicoccus albus]|uniref:Uncharacterized protein n=1 Tax=Pelagicoccus albus TaxID=415222 RepID=A0A7X1B2N0_9BACT|nr:hypothetical protein [Pelagicoccus albus]MBC2604508.1 hypothetical protein [Pelagicoccus albus]